MQTRYLEHDGKRYAVEFISTYQGQTDWRVQLLGQQAHHFTPARLRFCAGDCVDTSTEHFPTAHGFPHSVGVELVFRVRDLELTDAAHYCARKGLLDYADEQTRKRAVELGLLTANT